MADSVTSMSDEVIDQDGFLIRTQGLGFASSKSIVKYTKMIPHIRLPSICATVHTEFSEKSYRGIQEITLSESIVELEDECFRKFDMLTHITLNEGLRKIGNKVFSSNRLMGNEFLTLELPKSLEEIGDEAFSGSIFKFLHFRDGSNLKRIGNSGFRGTMLASVLLPRSIVELGDYCFCQCSALADLRFERGSIIKKIGSIAFYGCNIRIVQIPKSVEEIGYYCFMSCENLSEVWFENGSKIRIIRDGAFALTRLRNFLVPKTVECIGNKCFEKCSLLTEFSVEAGSSLKEVGSLVFSESPISHIVVSAGDTKISDLLLKDLDASKVRVVTYESTEGVRRGMTYNNYIDISEYKQVRTLGSGGFGKVVVCEKGGDTIAVKFIPASSELNQTVFKREIQNLRPLSHPNIVNFRGFALPSAENDNNFIIAMDYVPGESLQYLIDSKWNMWDLNRNQYRTKTDKIAIICGIALGMAFVHWKGIIHGDLKPGNILFDTDTRTPYICDFGSSSLFSLESTTTTSRTFTPYYAAPELYNDQRCSEKIDIYSFGIIIYEIITMKRAFQNLSQLQHANQIARGIRPPMPSDVTQFARDLIVRCWAQDPEDRPSFAEICYLLRNNGHKIFAGCNNDCLNKLPWYFIDMCASSIHLESLPALDIPHINITKVDEVKCDDQKAARPQQKDYGLCDDIVDINEYQQVREIGSGGFGKVVLYEKGGNRVAAKLISAELEINQHAFQREIEQLKTLSHPQIVKLRGFALPSPKNGNNFVIVMDYISGGSLKDALDRCPDWFNSTVKTRIIHKIAQGMAFIHSNEVIHRDLKPGNILLDEDYSPYICDFGSSRLFSLETTMTSSLSFTPYYAAPELYNEQPYNTKVDVYSFGIIVYEIVTGKHAFRNLSRLQLVQNIVDGKHPTIPDTVSDFARDLIECCWDINPEKRPSFDEICDALNTDGYQLIEGCDPSYLINK